MAETAATIRLGLIQHACPLEADPARTFDSAIALMRDAAGRGATLIATQELFHLPYFPQEEHDRYFAWAEPIPGPTSQRLSETAKSLKVHLHASLFEKRAAGVFHNTSIMIDPAGAIVGKYRKMHIPDDPRFFEKYYFTPGDLNWQVQHLPHATTGTLICWDQWFPEAARLTALRGAQILFYPTAIAWAADETKETHRQQYEAWLTVQRAHAITNGVFVAAINRVGVERDLTFWGSSFVADPTGQIIAQAGGDQPEALVVDCDLARIDAWRQAWPFLRDRRIDAYGDLLKRYVD